MQEKRPEPGEAKAVDENGRELICQQWHSYASFWTYSGDSSIAEVDTEAIQDQKPHLGILDGRVRLVPLERTHVHDTCFVLECPLQGNGPFLLAKEDGILRTVRQQSPQPESQARSDGSQDEKDQLPVGDGVDFDASNSVRDQTTDQVGDAVSEIPSGLSSWLFFSGIEHSYNEGESGSNGCFSNALNGVSLSEREEPIIHTKKNRAVINPPKFFAAAWHMRNPPQRNLSYISNGLVILVESLTPRH